MPRVYLAGGYKSGWQDKIKVALKEYNFKWFDPKVKERPKSGYSLPMSIEEYGTWDLHHIRHQTIEDRYLLFLSKAASITFSDFGTAVNYLLSYHDPTDKQGVL